MFGRNRVSDLEHEVRRLNRSNEFLLAHIDALKAGGGELDKDNCVGPGMKPYDGSEVRLWQAPWGWSDHTVSFDAARGMFVQNLGTHIAINSGDQRCDFWKPVNNVKEG